MVDSRQLHIVAITALIRHPREDRFLIVRRRDDEIAYPGMWAYPGGKVEREERISEALKREIQEETGLELREAKHLLKEYTFVRPDGHNVIGLCFLAEVTHSSVILCDDLTEYRWILPSELRQFSHIPGMQEEITAAQVVLKQK